MTTSTIWIFLILSTETSLPSLHRSWPSSFHHHHITITITTWLSPSLGPRTHHQDGYHRLATNDTLPPTNRRHHHQQEQNTTITSPSSTHHHHHPHHYNPHLRKHPPIEYATSTTSPCTPSKSSPFLHINHVLHRPGNFLDLPTYATVSLSILFEFILTARYSRNFF